MIIKIIKDIILEIPQDAQLIEVFENDKSYDLVGISTKSMTYRKTIEKRIIKENLKNERDSNNN